MADGNGNAIVIPVTNFTAGRLLNHSTFGDIAYIAQTRNQSCTALHPRIRIFAKHVANDAADHDCSTTIVDDQGNQVIHKIKLLALQANYTPKQTNDKWRKSTIDDIKSKFDIDDFTNILDHELVKQQQRE